MIQARRVHLVCRYSQRWAMWCAHCHADVELAEAEEAAQIAGTNVEAIINHAACGKIHLGITPEALLFCVNSLLSVKAFFKNAQSVGH